MKSLLIKKMIMVVIAIALIIGFIPLFANSTSSLEEEHVATAASKVYYAKTSKKYHSRKSCRTLARSKKIYSTTKAKAKKMGLKPCKVCY